MAYNRERTNQSGMYLYGESWSKYSGPDPAVNSVFSGKTSFCQDTIGSGGSAHDLFLEHRMYRPWILNYNQKGGEPPNGGTVYRDVPQPKMGGAYGLEHLIKADGGTATEVMARTNPSRAHASIPNFLSELRELPLLLKKVGDNVLTKIATGNISYKFGLKPLVSDLLKMTEFSRVARRRFENLQKLQEDGGLKRKITVSSAFQSGGFVRVQGNYSHEVHDYTSSKCWATVRWVSSESFPTTDEALENYIYRSIRGIDPSQLTSVIWEALPWSWLVDWYAEVGSYLIAHNNSVAQVAGPICIMTQTTTTRRDTVTHPNPEVQITQPSESLVTKERDVVSGSSLPEAHIPLLNGNQLSILGSLAILKGGKR